MSRPPFCPSQFAMPAKGGTFRYPLLPWDGVALSYPIDATICRTGAVFAICDNGAAVHQVDTGAADRLAGVRISDAGGAASSCPNFGRLPAGVIVLQNAAPPLLSRSIRAQMYGFFIFQHRQRLRDFRFSHRCDRLRILPTISAIWPVARIVGSFPRSLRPLAGPVVGFTLRGYLSPLRRILWLLWQA